MEKLRPQTITNASGCSISEPSPRPSARGVIPSTVVSVVIRIGRRRRLAAVLIASSVDGFFPRSISICSTSTMALLTTMPASMIRPSQTGMEIGRSNSHRPRPTPVIVKGTLNRMISGLRNDSYCTAITTNTRNTASASRMPPVFWPCSSVWVAPPSYSVYPSGSCRSASRLNISLMMSAIAVLSSTEAVISTIRCC